MADAPMTAESLTDRIAAAEGRVAALKAERAQAALAGQPFDRTSLRAAEDDLEALRDADAAVQGQADDAARDAAEAHAAGLRREALELEDKRRASIEEAEGLCRAMVDALQEAEAHRAEVEARFRKLGLPGSPGQNDQAVRLARCVSAVLTPLCGKHSVGMRWGDLILRRGFCTPHDAWTKQEETITARTRAAMEAGK